MKSLDEKQLIVRKCNPRIDAPHHMKACRNSRDYLEHHLCWGETAITWGQNSHEVFLKGMAEMPGTLGNYVVYYKTRFAGMFQHSISDDGEAAQICFWVPKQMSGNGIATTVTGMLTDKSFEVYGLNQVSLHVDKANVASSKVAERNGYEARREYFDEPYGTKDSGWLVEWIKYNPEVDQHH